VCLLLWKQEVVGSIPTYLTNAIKSTGSGHCADNAVEQGSIP
jgi:hypothetical protein